MTVELDASFLSATVKENGEEGREGRRKRGITSTF